MRLFSFGVQRVLLPSCLRHLVQSCRLLRRQQVLEPNREIHEIRHNFNLGLGEALLAAALHDERYAAHPEFHGDSVVEYVGDGKVFGSAFLL